MENIFLKQLAQKSALGVQEDANAPFSFVEWKQRKPGYNDSDLNFHYNQYVVDWFSNNKNKSVSQKFLLRQKYIYLLSQLQIFFSEEEKNEWYNRINLADEKELLLAIPYFAKKLKTISLYYLNLRKKLKNTKFRYNLVGTEVGIEQQIQERLLEVFSSLNTELPPEILNNLPEFNNLKSKLTVQVEQLYDDSVYFDKDPTVALSAYHDPFHKLTAEFFATKGLSLSSDEWIYNSFNIPITGNFDAFINELTGNVFEKSDEALYTSFIQKFLTDNKYTTTFESTSSRVVTTDIPLDLGTNYFYYPTGVTSNNSILSGTILPVVALSSLPIPEGATSSEVISGADTITVKIGNDVKSAWLKFTNFEIESKTKVTNLQDQTTSFIFPFPGYGLSADDIEWTGPSLSSTPEYRFLPNEHKSAVDEAYWSQILPADSVKPIPINETTLVKDGAYSNKSPDLADKLFVKERSLIGTASSTVKEAAWLYKFERTSIPISVTSSLSAFVWPLQHINSTDKELLSSIKQMNFQDLCLPTRVSDMDLPFAVASDKFETAEKIYKFQKYDDLIVNATECCWLSGRLLSAENYAWAEQGGFSCVLSAGEIARFVWTGPDKTPISRVFSSTTHSANCPFVTSEETDPTRCSCKQVFYSPFGHNGGIFTNNNANADFIAVDTVNDIHPFNLNSWRDELSGTYESSTQFAWYKTNKSNSWGDGQWVSTSPTGEIFSLETGKSYYYKRTTSKDDTVYPLYAVSYVYPTNNTVWIEARKLASGEWITTDVPSIMTLRPGDIIRWEKQPVNTFYHLSSVSFQQSPDNISSAWASHDFLPIPLSANNYDYSLVIWPAFPQPVAEKRDIQFPLLSDGTPLSFPDVETYYYWKFTRQPTPDQYCNIKGTVWSEHDLIPITSTMSLKWPSAQSLESIELSGIDPQYPLNFSTPVLSSDVEEVYWWKMLRRYGTNQASSSTTYFYNPTITQYLTALSGVPNISLIEVPSLSSDLSHTPPLTGTYFFEISARLVGGQEYYFTEVPEISVAPLLTYYFYDSFFVMFNPELSGTYETETSVKLVDGQNYIFNDMPLITAVPVSAILIQTTSQEHKAGGYVIRQPLSGWNYTTNTFEGTNESGGATIGAKPYWAVFDITNPETNASEAGYPSEFIDGYLPNRTPRVSPIVLNYDNTIEYRRGGNRFTWKQPLEYGTFVGTSQWSQVTSVQISSEGSFTPYQIVDITTEVQIATSTPTNIVLSNFVQGKPVEVYYTAQNSFVWQISVDIFEGSQLIDTELLFEASQPWTTLSNRFFPTVATVPVAENLYSEKDSGGFFTSTKLGASKYINDNFTTTASSSELLNASFITENPEIHIGGRGLTKNDQETIYTWQEDNRWIKESPITNQLAGAVKKSLTKSLQTFVPYQNSAELKQFGLVTPTSRVSPWGGEKENEWTDTLNEPKGFTGVRNVSAWADSQILKQNQKVMDCWVSDIYGTQYGLFKNIDSNASIYDKSLAAGQLWLRTNDQTVSPAHESLSSVFTPFKTIDTTIYKQLTGEGIVNVDCFFDTLVIQTADVVIYSKVRYNYETEAIEGLLDNTRFKYLTRTNDTITSAGQSWFFGTEKKLYSLFVNVSGGQLLPELYQFNLTDNTFTKQFPYNVSEENLLIQALSGLQVKSTQVGLLTYSSLLKQFLITIFGLLTNEEQFLVDIIVDNREDLTVSSVTIYTDTKHSPIPFSTNVMVLSNYFYETIPLTFTAYDTIQIYAGDYATLSVSAINDPTYFELINYTTNLTALSDGTFIAYFENPGLYHVNYKVGNDVGFNLGCLTLSAISREDVILLNGQEEGFLVLDGYNGRYFI